MTDGDEPIGPEATRTYSGWKMTLAIIAAITVVALAINVAGDRNAPRPLQRTPPVITSVSPTPEAS